MGGRSSKMKTHAGRVERLQQILKEHRVVHKGPVPSSAVIKQIWDTIDENGDGAMDRKECRMLMKGIVANTIQDMEGREGYVRLAHRCECLRKLLTDKRQLDALVDKVFVALGKEGCEEVPQREFARFFRRIIR